MHEEKIHVMWTNLEEEMSNWSPNHFVPVVLRDRQRVPKRGDFHILQWNKQDFVGQVLEMDEVLGISCVKFMKKNKEGLFYWPVLDDFSWEPFSSFVREVELTLVEGVSKNRCQLYSAK